MNALIQKLIKGISLVFNADYCHDKPLIRKYITINDIELLNKLIKNHDRNNSQ